MVMRAFRISGQPKATKPAEMTGTFSFKEGPLTGTVEMIEGRICTHNTIKLDDDRFVVNDQLQNDVTAAVLARLRAENGQ
jgi:hypothetical protein